MQSIERSTPMLINLGPPATRLRQVAGTRAVAGLTRFARDASHFRYHICSPDDALDSNMMHRTSHGCAGKQRRKCL